jgi:hypothetical protein
MVAVVMPHTYNTGKDADLEAFVNENVDKFESVGSFSYTHPLFEVFGIETIEAWLCTESNFRI